MEAGVSVWLIAAAAVALMGLSKGGFSGLSVLSMPLLALVVPPVAAAAVMLPILLMQDVVSVAAYRRDADWRLLAILLPGAVVGIGLGYLFSARIDEAAVRLAVGLIAVGFCLRAWTARGARAEAAPRRVGPGVVWGAVAGFTSFVSHAGAPPFQVYVLPLRLEPRVYAGTNTMFFAAANLIKVLPYALLGQFGAENLAFSAKLFPVAIVSTLAGVWLVRRVPAGPFYRIILVLTFLVGCKLVWDGGRASLGL
ncbi:MAG: sulfite exporter TauE/SafE family protein [Rhizobiales bacterium]|nr:sulfite exporter TauE/SafE family protein [Hyphomicrobiales bacterium]